MKNCGGRKSRYKIPLPAKLVSFLKGKAAKSVLDVGCGYGRVCFYLAENGYDVVGVDIDKTQIRSALDEIKSNGLSQEIGFLVDDAQALCFPDSVYDAVTMLGILTLASKSERSKIVNEAFRVLKPSGCVFVEEFGRTWGNPVYAKRYREVVEVTGEMGTITVRNEEGKILHLGHHFTPKELLVLFAKFRLLAFEESAFTSYYHGNWVKGYVILAQKRTTR